MNPRSFGILLVEDDLRLRDQLHAFLAEDYTVTKTSDPRLALKVLGEDPLPRWILISDFHLPEMTGTELILSALNELHNIVGVILMSADPDISEHAQEVCEALKKKHIPITVISKPFLPDDFLNSLKTIASLSSLQ